jgi:hypothetical protein
MYKQMYQEQQLREQFIDKSRSNRQVKKGEVEAYQQEVERFQELLLVLMHISRGQAARALELLRIR